MSNSIYYKTVNIDHLTFEEAFNKGRFITNNDYGGFMFKDKQGRVMNLLVNGDIIVSGKILDKEKRIWKTVALNEKGYEILLKNNLI